MASETVVQQQARTLHCQLTNGQNWRNNVGACVDKTGRQIRYGLGNDSAQLNKIIKSSDLIGATPEWVYTERAGWHWAAIFTAMECKHSDWVMPIPIVGRAFDDQPEATQRALAQLRFHDIVRSVGGYAGFVTGPDDVKRIIHRGG